MMTIFTYASVLPTISPNQCPPHLTEICDGGKERQGGVLLLTFDLHKVVVEQVLRIRRMVLKIISKVHSINPEVTFFRTLPAPQRAPRDCGQKSLRGTLCLQIIMIAGEGNQWKKMKGQS